MGKPEEKSHIILININSRYIPRKVKCTDSTSTRSFCTFTNRYRTGVEAPENSRSLKECVFTAIGMRPYILFYVVRVEHDIYSSRPFFNAVLTHNIVYSKGYRDK